jgi:hypothetical protein
MANGHEGGIKKVAKEIRQEAARQLRGFPGELRRQVTGGWGSELANQLFGTPRGNRRRSRSR